MEEQNDELIIKKRIELDKTIEIGFLDEENTAICEKLCKLNEANNKVKRIKTIRYIHEESPYGTIKQAIDEQWKEDGSFRFIINQNKMIKGKVTNKIEEGIIEIPLVELCERKFYTKRGEQIETELCVFGSKRKKDAIVIDSLTHKFNLYRMIVREGATNQLYTIISEKNLEIGEYEVFGMALELEDYAEISKYTKLVKKSNIIFLNEAKSSKITFKSKNEFIDLMKGLDLTEDKFFQNFLSVEIDNKYLYFQHPRYFERLAAAFFISSRFDSSPYPLHWIIIGKQGGGKSKVMEALSEKTDEAIPIVEGSGSTMKSLIPSFKGDLTKPGALIESNRIVFIDEFFRILMRVDKDDRESTLTHLNPLLEHKKRRFGSGNNFLDAQMTSKLFAVTNPVFGTSNMDALVKKLDNSFLSRIFIWYQDEEHYNSILAKKESDLKTVDITISKEIWKSIFDFCSSFKADINLEEYDKIHAGGLEVFGSLCDEVREIYKTRYKHHLMCLIDGIVKLRCILEGDAEFKAKSEDFATAREIWVKMIENWRNGLQNVRFAEREGRFY